MTPQNRFNVIDTLPNVSIEEGNHKSALHPSNRDIVEAQIKEELDNFQYKIVNKKPVIISALGAIPKKCSNKIRLIHDASRPAGQSLSDLTVPESFKYQFIQDAINCLNEGCFLSKVDLSNAYRAVRTHPSN